MQTEADNFTLNCRIVTCIKCAKFIIKNCRQICKTYLTIWFQFPLEACLCMLRTNCSGNSKCHCIMAAPQSEYTSTRNNKHFFFSLFFTMAPSLIETNQPFYSNLIFLLREWQLSGVAQRFDLFILTFFTHCFYDAPQSVESLWVSDQPVADTST